MKKRRELLLYIEELSVAEWLTREEIPTEYDGISLTNEMIMRFKNGEDR